MPATAPPARPRLRLQPNMTGHTPLDGGWWPRSSDPAAELPGLILALDERYGPVTGHLGRPPPVRATTGPDAHQHA